MAKDEEKGNPMSDLKWFIVIILTIWFIGRFGGISGLMGDTDKVETPKSVSSQNKTRPSDSEITRTEDGNSKWKGMVKISRGNASSAVHPNQEYITLQADINNKSSVTITGWSLANGKDRKFFLTGNDKQVRGVSDRVTIPTGTLIFIPNSLNAQQNISLGPGDKAIILTGKVANGIPFEIKTNFKENICSGYIEDLENYDFTPSLSENCPSAQDEDGVNSLDEGCYKFVRSMSVCHTPEFKDIVYKNKEPITGFVDNVGDLSYSCKNFLKEHYNYKSCVINHLSDKNFFGNEWRVFLNYPRELWAKDRETITLYDGDDKIVDELTYGY